MLKQTVLLLATILIMVSSSMADKRNYVWTYQYFSMPEGASELEFYQTTKVRDTKDWEYRVEVEHGITSHLDLAIYQIFGQDEGESLKWNASQLRIRYRIGEQGQYFVDPLIYLEYNRKTDLGKPNKFEAKLILAKTEEKFNISVNPVYELFWAPDVEHEVGLDVGVSYQFHPKFTAAVESTSRMEFEDGETETASYAGPTLSLASGNWYYTFGVAFGLNDESDDARVRFIMGIHL